MNLKNKRVLITAGPTWVPIDNVRVISNIATGVTGALLAREAANQGARVALVLGQSSKYNNPGKSIRIIHFRFFNELKDILKRELQSKKYDIIIHSAAVSDFYPVRKKFSKEKGLSNGVKPEYKISGKLSSDKIYGLKLLPLEKLIVLIRRLKPQAKLVMFKLESNVQDKTLIQRAKSAGEKCAADLIVANRLNPYRAFIIGKQDNRILAKSKEDLAKKLIKVLNII